jgi:hypothetical protein
MREYVPEKYSVGAELASIKLIGGAVEPAPNIGMLTVAGHTAIP